MITIVIEVKGEPEEATKLAKRIASAEQQSGKSVRLYDYDAVLPANFPADADIVIVVTQT